MTPSNRLSIVPALCTDDVGTLGTFVNYHAVSKDEVKKYFLICYHMIAPGNLNRK